MKKSISQQEFVNAFTEMNREENFSYDGLCALYDYLEEYEDSCDTEITLDVIVICCEFSEYANINEFQADYGNDYVTIEDIESETTVVQIDDESFIIQNF